MKKWREAIESFKKNNNFRETEKCCGTCKHCDYDGDLDFACRNEELRSMSENGYLSIAYLSVQQHDVCDKWEEDDR